jgi:hypothetical protein
MAPRGTRGGGRGGDGQGEAPQAGLARPAAQAPTKRELAAFVDELVDTVNLKIDKAALEYEEAANTLFRKVFQNASTPALSSRTRATPAYRLLRARAGHSLKLTPDDLREFVIIGALNQRIPQTGR